MSDFHHRDIRVWYILSLRPRVQIFWGMHSMLRFVLHFTNDQPNLSLLLIRRRTLHLILLCQVLSVVVMGIMLSKEKHLVSATRDISNALVTV